jgi:hypothetical protein
LPDELKPGSNGEPSRLELTEIAINWDGKCYRITGEAIARAFDKSPAGDITGPHARYYLQIDGDLKGLESVFRSIVPIPKEKLTPDIATQICEMVQSLGFIILDTRKHHGL